MPPPLRYAHYGRAAAAGAGTYARDHPLQRAGTCTAMRSRRPTGMLEVTWSASLELLLWLRIWADIECSCSRQCTSKSSSGGLSSGILRRVDFGLQFLDFSINCAPSTLCLPAIYAVDPTRSSFEFSFKPVYIHLCGNHDRDRQPIYHPRNAMLLRNNYHCSRNNVHGGTAAHAHATS